MTSLGNRRVGCTSGSSKKDGEVSPMTFLGNRRVGCTSGSAKKGRVTNDFLGGRCVGEEGSGSCKKVMDSSRDILKKALSDFFSEEEIREVELSSGRAEKSGDFSSRGQARQTLLFLFKKSESVC